MGLLGDTFDVCQGEVITLEQQRLFKGFREGIRETVPKVQLGLVAPLAKIEESLPRDQPLLDGDRLDPNSRAPNKRLGMAGCLWPQLLLDDHRKLEKTGDAQSANFGVMDDPGKLSSLFFAIENSNQCRCVDDHLGSPSES